jgi:hypothetical protein
MTNTPSINQTISSLDDVRHALAGADPAGLTDIVLGQSTKLTVHTADLATVLGVTLLMVAYQAYVTVRNLHIRATPGTSGALLRDIPFSTQVAVLSTPAQTQDGFTWVQIRLADGSLGYCASGFLSKTVPTAPINPVATASTVSSVSTPVTVAPSGRHKTGLHVLQDGVSAVLNFATAIKQAGGIIPSVTVLNDQNIATQLANGLVQRVVFRYVPDGTTETVNLPVDEAGAIAVGRQWVAGKFSWGGWAGLKGDNIYVQVVNEIPYGPMHYAYWLGVMQELEARGHKAAIGGYAVGNPEPDQWATLAPALRYAAQHGHIAVLHAYCAPDTTPGQLSATNLQQYYELRFLRFYAAAPADARPPLVLSEFGGEFTRGKFQGTGALQSLCAAFEAAVTSADYLVGYNLWTLGSAGGWSDASIDSALSSLNSWIGK